MEVIAVQWRGLGFFCTSLGLENALTGKWEPTEDDLRDFSAALGCPVDRLKLSREDLEAQVAELNRQLFALRAGSEPDPELNTYRQIHRCAAEGCDVELRVSCDPHDHGWELTWDYEHGTANSSPVSSDDGTTQPTPPKRFG